MLELSKNNFKESTSDYSKIYNVFCYLQYLLNYYCINLSFQITITSVHKTYWRVSMYVNEYKQTKFTYSTVGKLWTRIRFLRWTRYKHILQKLRQKYNQTLRVIKNRWLAKRDTGYFSRRRIVGKWLRRRCGCARAFFAPPNGPMPKSESESEPDSKSGSDWEWEPDLESVTDSESEPVSAWEALE